VRADRVPAEDLLFKAQFIDDNLRALDQLRENTRDSRPSSASSTARTTSTTPQPSSTNGELRGVVKKSILPNYGVFDENRYFQTGGEAAVYHLGELTFG